MKKIIQLIIVLMLFSTVSFAQDITKDSLHVSGVVFGQDSLLNLSGVHIKLNDKGLISDYDGKFSLWVHPYDTVEFSYIGFKTLKVAISDSLTIGAYGFGIFMAKDTIQIGEVIVFPRPNFGKPEIEIVNMKTEKDTKIATQNLRMAAFTAIRRPDNATWDAERNQQFQQQRMKMDAITKGGIPYDEMVSVGVNAVLPYGKNYHKLPKDFETDYKLSKYEEEILIDFYKIRKKK